MCNVFSYKDLIINNIVLNYKLKIKYTKENNYTASSELLSFTIQTAILPASISAPASKKM